MINDFRFAFRMLWKNPAFSFVAIATLALGIGANTAVLSLVNALLLRPLPYKNPQQLVLIWEQFSRQGLDRIPVSAPEYLDYEKELRSYDGIAAFDYVSLNLTGDSGIQRAGVVGQSAQSIKNFPADEFFTALGVGDSTNGCDRLLPRIKLLLRDLVHPAKKRILDRPLS